MDPNQMAGESPIGRLLPYLQQLGKPAVPALEKALQLLGVMPPSKAAPPTNAPLPRSAGVDAMGNPIIVPPGQQMPTQVGGGY